MSNKKSSPENKNQVPDLSALDFGPAWARKDQGKKPRRATSGKSSAGHGGRRGKDGHDGKPRARGPRRDGKDGRYSERKDNYKKRPRHHKPMTPAPEGVTARIMPIEEGMDAMAKQISATGRTHSVFELAWVVLGALDRFHVIFESADQDLYRSKSDHSVWMTKKECMAHMWSSGSIKKYYDEEITEVDPPSGNFQSVARCGFSGKLIGPPNHHAYQQILTDLHREQFSNMALDRYKSKIVMEHSEEAVQEWIDAMCKHKRWRPKSEQATAEDTAEPSEVPADQPAAVETTSTEPASGEPAAEDNDAQPEGTDAVDAPEPESTPEPVIEQTVIILDNHREVEQHFLTHGFEDEFEASKIVSALANIPGRMISPGLMTLLKNTVSEEKRYPGNLASILCRQMSGRHLAVFKWKKRLHCGPARPRRVPDDLVIADRPEALFHWVIDNPGGNIDAMWKDCLPAEIDDDGRHTWYHDLHWLINEGLVLLFSDGTLHAAKELEKKPTSPTKQAKKKTDTEKAPAEPAAKEKPEEKPKAEKAEKPSGDKPQQAPKEKEKPDDAAPEPTGRPVEGKDQ